MASVNIESETLQTVSTIKELFLFLNDFKNFHSILPADKVEDFQYSENECSFNIKGITPMKILVQERKPFEHLVFTSQGLAKFDFTLKVSFIGEPDQKGECRVELFADMNPFIMMMAEKPLKQLVNTMVQRLAELRVESL